MKRTFKKAKAAMTKLDDTVNAKLAASGSPIRVRTVASLREKKTGRFAKQ